MITDTFSGINLSFTHSEKVSLRQLVETSQWKKNRNLIEDSSSDDHNEDDAVDDDNNDNHSNGERRGW